jgi:osmotically-inducible protein OsmY
MAVAFGLGTLPAAADDAAIRAAIEKRIERAKLDGSSAARVGVRDGEVTLTGTAASLPVRRAIGRAARKEARTVHDALQVVLQEPVSDAELVAAVRSAILRYPRDTIFDYVEFGVKDGGVLLQGSVLHPWKKDEIEERVARVAGVREIRNDVAVQSVSSYDSELRLALARRIFGDVRFVHYAHRAHPPIRILVDRGRITLAGAVASPVEQAVLGHIARGFLAFGVDNRLVVDGDPPKAEQPAAKAS